MSWFDSKQYQVRQLRRQYEQLVRNRAFIEKCMEEVREALAELGEEP